ncbi:hypothetical protein VTK56DRAFT_3770 [Thermocarpiscus australiensis]
MPSSPATLGDFSVLPVSIPPLPSFPRNAVHYLYVRRHAPKIPTPTDSRSLFVTNVPVDSTEAHLRALVASLVGPGRFESATFEGERKAPLDDAAAQPAHAARLLQAHSRKRKREDEGAEQQEEEEDAAARLPSTWTRPLRRSGSTAVVLLADEKSVEQVLKAVAKAHRANSSSRLPVWGEGIPEGKAPPALGSAWLRAHNRLSYPDRAALQASVDAFSALFARREREAAELAKRLRNEPDEDGFVTVTRGGGRNAPVSRTEAEEAKRRMLERQEKKKEELTNFYRFQLRERNKAEQAELLKRFDEDRRKLEAMRQKKGKFVPEA